MHRIRLLIAGVLVAVATIGVAPLAFAQEGPGRADEPAVVIDEGGAVEEDAAWTFRFLVPTLVVVTGVALAGTVLFYGVRVKGRYRVVR